jgi:hypothetical protein
MERCGDRPQCKPAGRRRTEEVAEGGVFSFGHFIFFWHIRFG